HTLRDGTFRTAVRHSHGAHDDPELLCDQRHFWSFTYMSGMPTCLPHPIQLTRPFRNGTTCQFSSPKSKPLFGMSISTTQLAFSRTILLHYGLDYDLQEWQAFSKYFWIIYHRLPCYSSLPIESSRPPERKELRVVSPCQISTAKTHNRCSSWLCFGCTTFVWKDASSRPWPKPKSSKNSSAKCGLFSTLRVAGAYKHLDRKSTR